MKSFRILGGEGLEGFFKKEGGGGRKGEGEEMEGAGKKRKRKKGKERERKRGEGARMKEGRGYALAGLETEVLSEVVGVGGEVVDDESEGADVDLEIGYMPGAQTAGSLRFSFRKIASLLKKKKGREDDELSISEPAPHFLSQILPDFTYVRSHLLARRKFLCASWSGFEAMVPLHQQQ